jgi:hypothetical protein
MTSPSQTDPRSSGVRSEARVRQHQLMFVDTGPWRPWPPPHRAARSVGADFDGDRQYAAAG